MPPDADQAALPRHLGDGPKGRELRSILGNLVESLPPGSPLPSERELAERFELARMTVRGEINRLVAEGLVYRIHGRGTFVAEPRVEQEAAFSSFSEDMRARGLQPGSIVRSLTRTEADGFLAGALELAPAAPVVCLERVRTADGEPTAIEQVFLPEERYPGIEQIDFSEASLFEVLAERYGTRMQEASQRVVAVAIEGDDATVLGAEDGQPGLSFHTLARDGEGKPAYFAVSLFRGDRYEVALHQTRDSDGDRS